MKNALDETLDDLRALAANPQAAIDSNDMQWLQAVARSALAVVEPRPILKFTEASLDAFYSRAKLLSNKTIPDLQSAINAAFLRLRPIAYTPQEFSNRALEMFYSKIKIDQDGCIEPGDLEQGLMAVALATPAMKSFFDMRVEQPDGAALLEIARSTGLRGALHGINATDARKLLSTFVSAVHAGHAEPDGEAHQQIEAVAADVDEGRDLQRQR